MGGGDRVVARARSPNRDKAFQLWRKSNGERLLKDIASELGIRDSQVRKWKSQDKWEHQLKGNVTNKPKSNVTNRKRNVSKPKHHPSIKKLEDADLTEKQRLFCLYYIKSFNATMAAIKAGYSRERAHVTGSELVRNSKVAAEIRRLKGAVRQEVFVDAIDVLNKYIKIAFADISDFVEFGNKDAVVGVNIEGEFATRTISYADIKDSDIVDGSIISEVKKTKEGIMVKLHDKMKALEKLEKYFDLLPDQHKRKLEEEKSSLDKKKYELDKRVVELRENEAKMKEW
jgi:phage terminase small subunit